MSGFRRGYSRIHSSVVHHLEKYSERGEDKEGGGGTIDNNNKMNPANRGDINPQKNKNFVSVQTRVEHGVCAVKRGGRKAFGKRRMG